MMYRYEAIEILSNIILLSVALGKHFPGYEHPEGHTMSNVPTQSQTPQAKLVPRVRAGH
jgi:hypothetical protein